MAINMYPAKAEKYASFLRQADETEEERRRRMLMEAGLSATAAEVSSAPAAAPSNAYGISDEAYDALSADVASAENKVERQRKMADSIRGNQLDVVASAGGPSNIKVANPFNALANIATAGIGGYMDSRASKQEREEVDPQRAALAKALRDKDAALYSTERGDVERDFDLKDAALSLKEQQMEADRVEAQAKFAELQADANKAAQEGESELRQEFTKLGEVKQFKDVDTAYGRVLAGDPTSDAATQMSLIFNYMKMLDPGSTVREGEFATASNTTGIPGKVINMYNSAKEGKFLNPEQVMAFQTQAGELYKNQRNMYEVTASSYADLANKYGHDVDSVITFQPRFTGEEGGMPEEVGNAVVGAPLASAQNEDAVQSRRPESITPELWRKMVERMTDEEKRARGIPL